MGGGPMPAKIDKIMKVEKMLHEQLKEWNSLVEFLCTVEDSGLVNAGIGSALNRDGIRELDASLLVVKH